ARGPRRHLAGLRAAALRPQALYRQPRQAPQELSPSRMAFHRRAVRPAGAERPRPQTTAAHSPARGLGPRKGRRRPQGGKPRRRGASRRPLLGLAPDRRRPPTAPRREALLRPVPAAGGGPRRELLLRAQPPARP